MRLHLPKHHAIASWSTTEGRQAAFVGRTIPLRVDPARIALHAARQHARGARHQTDLRQRHWDQRAARAPAAGPATAGRRAGVRGHGRRDPRTASYRELLEIDRAQSVRWGRAGTVRGGFEPEPLDLEMLVMICELGHLLSSQIHRWFNPTRAPTTTQRRLKRLSDAGLVDRLQFHRRDGGGAPMCYRLSGEGRALLSSLGAVEDALEPDPLGGRRALPRDPGQAHRVLRRVRREIHVAGWALSLMRFMDLRTGDVRGRERAVLTPPASRAGNRRGFLGPEELRLAGGRVPHDFLSSRGCRERAQFEERPEVEQFETVRPDALVRAPGVDILIELDDRLPRGPDAAKLERYDHFLTGWSLHTRRYGDRGEAVARGGVRVPGSGAGPGVRPGRRPRAVRGPGLRGRVSVRLGLQRATTRELRGRARRARGQPACLRRS